MNIVVRMRGGLGNQLFIISYAYYLAENCKSDPDIILDLREYDTYKTRDFELLDILRDKRIKILSGENSNKYYDITRNIFHLFQKIIRKETMSIGWLSFFGLYYGRRKALYRKIFNRKNIYVYGYFQDARMCACIREVLLSRLIIPSANELNLSGNISKIAVSIRCGQDYVRQGWPICSGEYFNNGVKMIINEKYMHENVAVLVFSDDMETAKDILNENSFGDKIHIIYIDGKSPIEQLAIIKECDDFVISNSSFSWWGAYIGAADNSIVVMPSRWYRTGEDTIHNYLIYENTRIVGI